MVRVRFSSSAADGLMYSTTASISSSSLFIRRIFLSINGNHFLFKMHAYYTERSKKIKPPPPTLLRNSAQNKSQSSDICILKRLNKSENAREKHAYRWATAQRNPPLSDQFVVRRHEQRSPSRAQVGAALATGG